MTEAKPATTRISASKAIAATSDTARDLARKTAEGIEANPVGVLAGGVALGVLLGAFLPRSEHEAKLLAPVGKRISDTTRGAFDAAKDTAKAELDVLGFTRTAARDQVGKMLGGVVRTLATAGTAAVAAAKAQPAAPEAAPATKKPAAKKAKPKA
ncbi:hypothetical protein [Sphingomonas sp.]|uniref:hypothetical protein n=1 Tax=Sphingomonas sp. TaxID=28214 RepID=UPI00333EE331